MSFVDELRIRILGTQAQAQASAQEGSANVREAVEENPRAALQIVAGTALVATGAGALAGAAMIAAGATEIGAGAIQNSQEKAAAEKGDRVLALSLGPVKPDPRQVERVVGAVQELEDAKLSPFERFIKKCGRILSEARAELEEILE